MARRPGIAALPWVLLALAMIGSSILILSAGRDTTLSGDELYYYGRLIDDPGSFVSYDGVSAEYLLAPHNGHFQTVGKLVYEAVFASFGVDYLVLRVIELVGLLLCVGLVFELARRRVGSAPALPGAVLLLFLGAAWEVMIWPFDLHTVYAFAAGLAAVLTVERGGRYSAPLACGLLVLSIATIEVGLAMAVAVAAVLWGRDRDLRSAWVVAIPLVAYGAWWLWARQFAQGDFSLSNLDSLPLSVAESLSATLGSMTGRIDAGAGVFPQTVGINGWGIALAVAAMLGLALRVHRARGSQWLWGMLAALVAYWALIALAGRPPDSSRYMFVSSALVILIAAEAMRGTRASRGALIAIFAVVALAMPANITKLFDGRLYQVSDAQTTRAHYAMLEFARDAVPPVAPARLARRGRDIIYGLAPTTYFEAADRFGSIALSLDEIRRGGRRVREAADVSLAQLLELELEPAPAPADPSGCRSIGGPGPVTFELPAGGALLASISDSPALGIGRFSVSAPSVQLGELPAEGWSDLEIPPDSAAEPWRAFATGVVRLCDR